MCGIWQAAFDTSNKQIEGGSEDDDLLSTLDEMVCDDNHDIDYSDANMDCLKIGND